MRVIIAFAMLMALSPIAFAQTDQPDRQPNPSGYMPNETRASDTRNTQLNPNNCGTPDEPKACPSMPRRPLHAYRSNRE